MSAGERLGTDDVDDDARAETAVPRDSRHFDRPRLFGEDETVLLHGDAALFAAFYGGELEVVFAVCGIHGQDVDDDVFVILIFRDVHGDDAVFGSRGDLHPRDGMSTATDAAPVNVMMVNMTMSGMTAIKAISLFFMPCLRSPLCIFCQARRRDRRERR